MRSLWPGRVKISFVQQNSHHKDYFNLKGYSTKMKKLIEDVKEDMGDTKRFVGLLFCFCF